MAEGSFPRIAIIGTSGRKEAGERLNAPLYARMIRAVEQAVGVIAPSGAMLVSGGAAYADHIAVRLFLAAPAHYRLRLCLPCPVVEQGFARSGTNRFWDDPGATLDDYHTAFSRVVGTNSMQELRRAMAAKGCEVSIHDGLEARNEVVAAESEYLIALTFGEGRRVADGGTWRTAKAFLKKPDTGARSFHISLPCLTVHSPVSLKDEDVSQMQFGL